jgi:hypothetical protein
MEHPKNKLLADHIEAFLEDGITISDTEARFIETTFAGAVIGNLIDVLSEPESFETETLFQLLLYPDPPFQRAIEAFLGNAVYTDTDVARIISLLGQKTLRAALRIACGPEEGKAVTVDVPATVLEPLMTRLKITRQIEPRICHALSQCLPDKPAVLNARVQLRNARFSFTEPVTDFFCRFLEKSRGMHDFFCRAFVFLIDVFDETDAGVDIYAALMRKKQICRQMIRQALETEKILREVPVEAVMMRGQPILCIDEADAREQMTLIDDICTLVFGITDVVADDADFNGRRY